MLMRLCINILIIEIFSAFYGYQNYLYPAFMIFVKNYYTKYTERGHQFYPSKILKPEENVNFSAAIVDKGLILQ